MRNLKTGVLCALLAALLLAGCTVNPDSTEPVMPADPTDPTPAVQETVPQQTQPVTEPETDADLAVQTPAGVLRYPAALAEHLDIRTMEGDVTTMTFVAVLEDREQPLFDLWFSHVAAEGAAGMVQAEGKKTYVGVEVVDFVPDSTWQQAQTDLVYAMQEALNVLLDQLALGPVEDAPDADLAIETPYGALHFPAKWEDRLQIRQPDGDTVEFLGALPGKEPQQLFTVCFGGDTDLFLTAPDGTRTAVGFIFAEPAFGSGWSQQEMDLIYAMQEDINYLIDALGQ